MARLFISHSSKDKIAAIAFKHWLRKSDWPDEDVFLDLDDIGAGERWKEALRKANARCEAIILLASPDALSSPECLAEVRKAEDYGKEIIVVLLRDLQLDDSRLSSYRERQIVDLSAPPQTHVETFIHGEVSHEVRFNAEALARVKAYLIKRGIAPEHFAWPPLDKPNAEPFPGLAAFTEDDAGIFFGRDSDILRGLAKLRLLRRDGTPRLLIIQAPSGAGKSSYLRAGLWPRLNREPGFAPLAILRPSKGILTGPDGLGRKLSQRLSRPGMSVSSGDIHAALQAREDATAADAFVELVARAAARAHEERKIADSSASPPSLVLAIDQAEELFGPEGAPESRRFLFLLGRLLRDPPAGVDPLVIWTIRAESTDRLLRELAEQKAEIPEMLPLRPLPPTSYRDVILGPVQVVARRGQRLKIGSALADRLVEDTTGKDALPLLAFTLSHLYQEFATEEEITVEHYERMGGVAGSIEMALKRSLAEPWRPPIIPPTEEEQIARLRAAFIPWLARIDPESGEPMRRAARHEDIPPGSRGLIERFVDARLLVSDGEAVEVAHESLLRQWPALSAWLAEDAEDLKLVEGVERAAGEWARSGCRPAWLDHRSERLLAGERLLARDEFRQRLGEDGATYLTACRASEEAGRQRDRRHRRELIIAFVILMIGVIYGILKEYGILEKISSWL